MANLAIAGGAPVRTQPHAEWPQFDGREKDAILGVLESRNWGGYPFPNRLADRFSRAFATYHGSRHALCAANGTVTLEIALKAVGLRPGDEVIVPAYTFEATAAPVLTKATTALRRGSFTATDKPGMPVEELPIQPNL